MLRALRLALLAILLWPLAATAQSLIVEKKTFAMPAYTCLLYTSPSPRDGLLSRMPSSA